MPYYPQTFPVASTTPANGAVDVATTSSIVVRFVAPMKEERVLAAFKVFKGPDRSLVPGTVIYDPKADPLTATFAPAQPLEPQTSYLVEIRGGVDGIQTTTGTTFPLSYTFQFTTATEPERPAAPLLQSPADHEAVTRFPIALSWAPVATPAEAAGLRYELQVALSFDFDDIVHSAHTPGTTFSLPPDQLEPIFQTSRVAYWRVRAVADYPDAPSLPGPWSEIRRFVYAPFDASESAAPIGLRLVQSFPADGAADVPIELTEVLLVFSGPVDGMMTVNDLSIWARQLGTRRSTLLALDDTALTINGTEVRLALTLQPDTEYRILVRHPALTEPVQVRFVTVLSRAYASIDEVRAELGGLGQEIPDAEIAWFLYEVSRYADRIAAAPYDTPSSVDAYGRTNAYWYEAFVRAEVGIRVLLRVSGARMARYGEQVQVGDIVIKQASSMAPDISVVLARLERRRDEAYRFLTNAGQPTAVRRGELTAPYPLNSRVNY